MIGVIYFRYSKKEKFLFTFFLIGIVVFFVSSIMKRVDICLGLTFGLFALGFFLVAGLEIYSNLILSNFIPGVLMLMALSATLIYRCSKTTYNHKKYLYYRTLAEALLIQFFWNLAGIDKNVSEYILRIHSKDFTWINILCLLSAELPTIANPSPPKQSMSL